ncbi:hypothetical protein K7X08_022195 [Anisodus acutangulus]|uniref:NAC domain-containing protein n=1 Tax=Anisodus acutangulus TaxID=402998 RepID=A0A9Q1L4P6_9SOLA|nr:hypothetical protein K7X08_022195 [Anisodus acutangulus]
MYSVNTWNVCQGRIQEIWNVLDKKYGNGARTNRATEQGYWKTTGKDRAVHHKSQVYPKGLMTNWVMHEYRLVDEELDKAGIPQILGAQTPVDSAAIHMNCSDGKNCTNSEEANDCYEDAQKWLQQPIEQKSLDPAVQHIADNPVMHDCVGQSSKNVNYEYVDYLLNGPRNDASDDLQFKDGAFLEANDLSNPIEADNPGFDMLEDYIAYFDANDDFQNLGFDHSVLIGNNGHVSDQASLPEKNIGELAQQVIALNEKLAEHKNSIVSSSIEKPTTFVAVPHAFALEFPTKDAALRLNSMSHSSSSVHVSAGLIQIRNKTVGDDGTDWSLGKHDYYNFILSFGLSRGSDNSATLESVASFPGKEPFMNLNRSAKHADESKAVDNLALWFHISPGSIVSPGRSHKYRSVYWEKHNLKN